MNPSGLSARLPRCTLLDVRRSCSSGHVADSVWIPVDELLQRLSELPPPYREVLIADVDPCAHEAARLLEQGGRACRLVEVPRLHEPAPSRGRLWEPNPLLDRVPESAGRLALDLGCGAGRDAVALASTGWRVHAVDRLESSARRTLDLAARYLESEDLTRITTQVADARTADLGGPYDLVTLFAWWDLRMVRRLPGLLSPGGTLLIEAFTPEHRLRHGRPGIHAVVGPEQLAQTLLPLTQVHCEVGDRGDRNTVRVIFTK